jgi:hypothetical protein
MKEVLGQPYKDRAVGIHTRDEVKCLVRLPHARHEEVAILRLGLRFHDGHMFLPSNGCGKQRFEGR